MSNLPESIDPQRTRIEALPYCNPVEELGRPGILSGVAVLSIVFGSLGLVASLFNLMTTSAQAVPGAVTSTMVVSVAGPTSTTTSTTTFTAPPYSTGVLVLAISSAGLDVVMAASLITIGILLLREHRRGRTMHVIYAWIKILVSSLAVWVNWLWYAKQMGSASGGSTASALIFVAYMSALFVLPGVLYATALLIVMNTRRIKAYYRTGDQQRIELKRAENRTA
jgi:hypothetical protein